MTDREPAATDGLGANLTPLDGPLNSVFLERFDAARQRQGLAPVTAAPTRAVLGTVADVSPFLGGLMMADPVLVDEVLSVPFPASLARAMACNADDVAASLRRGKRRLSLAVALADLCAGASVETVTEALSDFADAAISAALATSLAEAAGRGQCGTADPATSGLVVLAMGKLGGRELNYSSDIDLVVLVDPKRAGAAGLSIETAVRVTQQMARLLNVRGEDGYVFRVDLRLRPDPGSTAAAVSTRAAIAYYQSRARAWERQAMIKARQVGGDRAAGDAYLRAIETSVWHSGYDFTAIDDMLAMREQIAAVKGAGALTAPGHNVKVGRGGIREIEFYVQTLQRVTGGRDLELRGRSTVRMLAALAAKGWISEADGTAMTEAYHYLRRVEHRLQMVADEQVHTLPDEAGLPRIARMMRDAAFEANLRAMLERVHERFLSLGNGGLRANPILAGTTRAEKPVDDAVAAAFAKAAEVWHEGRYRSLSTERARRLLKRLEPDLQHAVAGSPDVEAALAGLDAFLARLPSGVDFLARIDRQRQFIPTLVLIVAAAPRVAAQLARRVNLLDVLIDPQFYGRASDPEAQAAALDRTLEAAPDYEDKLDALRSFGQEQMLLIEVRVLTGSLLSAEAGKDISGLAALLVSRALDVARRNFEAAHGRLKGGGVAILALGSFGSEEMTPASDLDLVFIYQSDDDAGESDGARPLSPGHYYTRLAQRFIAALSAPTSHGKLFEVDLRLRPSGRSGPLATHVRSFERYHAESAWVWEQMALTRARVVTGEPTVGERALEAIHSALTRARDPEALAAEVLEMRRKLDGLSATDSRHAPGGLSDVEFIAQFLLLRTGLHTTTTQTRRLLRELAAAGALDQGALETLTDAHRVFRKLMRLFAIAGIDAAPADAPKALQPLLLRAADAPDIAYLTADLAERHVAVREIFEELIGKV
ncbi:MAG: bifunctional [glutamine synthetase] adenylyltransferase/[glutamine synthetase]-adenylyl-L-tyrosine phosphorylase [Acuticoccus sp.]